MGNSISVAKGTESILYQNKVETLAQSKSTEIISNGLPEHAQAIYSMFFRTAEKEVRIFSNELRNDIYGTDSVIASLIGFLREKKGNVVVILQDINGIASDVNGDIFEVLKRTKRFIEVCAENAEKNHFTLMTCATRDKDIKNHFAIMDDCGYRFCHDKEVTEAIACFNDPETVMNLNSQFDILLSRAKPITILEKKHTSMTSSYSNETFARV